MDVVIYAILAYIAFLAGVLAVMGILKQRKEKAVHNLEKFCAVLPKEFNRNDPFILANGKWVQADPPGGRGSHLDS
jgi:hypothetical protein